MSHSVHAHDETPSVVTRYAWVVFALSFGLLLSDYMSRLVLTAVFPLLKTEWALSDARLGLLSGVVAFMVGLLTFPLSLLADRWGRVRSLTVMAAAWSLATLACAFAKNYEQMLIARLCVGVGEAAYGSVGVAVVISMFPVRLRATITAAFMAGGMFGSVLGVAGGGILATHFGWRGSFAGMAIFGLALTGLYALIVREPHRSASSTQQAGAQLSSFRSALGSLFATRSVISAYVGSGLQLFVAASLASWMPSYLNRYYDMAPDRASVYAAGFLLCSGTGMVVCGYLSDRLGRHSPERKLSLAIAASLLCFVLLSAAFYQPSGTLQLALLAAAMFIAAGTAGPAGAMVANLTHPAIHGAAFATLTLANNLLGLAPGPYLTGVLADEAGLLAALRIVPFLGLGATVAFMVGKRFYERDIERVRASAARAALQSAT
jgi:MFS family permease